MKDFFYYRCDTCTHIYFVTTGMGIRCPECRSKERTEIAALSHWELAELHLEFLKQNAKGEPRRER